MIREVLTLARLRLLPVDEAAALWTVRLAEGEFPHERELFDEWLGLSPANRAAWERSQASWQLFEHADGDELLDAMRHRARQAAPAKSEWRPRFAAAAALLLVAATGAIVADRSGMFGGVGSDSAGSAPPHLAAASLHYANGRELPKTVMLPDGSRLTLDAETSVSAQFGPEQRRLQVLSGRAFFAVQHEARRTFVVRARDIEVTAIGTKFDVRFANRNVGVALVEGRLSVIAKSAGGKPLLMSAGQQMIARDGERPNLTRDQTDALAWQQGYARFEDQSLADATAALNRYPGARLIVRDPHVAKLRISGNFKLGSPERFGKTLEQIYPVRVVRRGGNELEILPAG